MPTLEKLIEANKKVKKNKKKAEDTVKDGEKIDTDVATSKKAKATPKSEAKMVKELNKTNGKPKNSIELIESNIAKEEGRKRNYENLTKVFTNLKFF